MSTYRYSTNLCTKDREPTSLEKSMLEEKPGRETQNGYPDNKEQLQGLKKEAKLYI